ncbi:hypothetical protein AJ79_08112 [Helicocarpus griseus UAMH5409]|uniref:ATP-dependent DNA ligase family profile domain-containing protein n=1 Tax=Helicocarpus griseus UAMH5409 TaxID=1447875 RepID=A0A2B7WN25_9EURO|nr:hypothetical protein AJ79_08112 [Helicocarpus griseus UAMH5409]
MGFKFSYVCDLFSNLEANLTLKAATASKRLNPDVATITDWFNRHSKHIHGGPTDRLALLSCLFPERRPERVFGLKEPSLIKVIGRCLLLGTCRRAELESYKKCGNGDLGDCVERVMKQAENDRAEDCAVTVEEIDAILNQIASKCRFSGPDVRQRRTAVSVDEALGPIFRRLTSREAKWFTRLILKELSPITLPSSLVLRNFHFLLPDLLWLQDSLKVAIDILDRDSIKRLPSRPDPQYAKLLASLVSPHIPLTVGVKVGRPMFHKARGVKHCCRIAGKRTMSVERKYDGEYCQIHIDLDRRPNCIQIFSKSGKDSTSDRRGIHSVLRDCLKIGKRECKISKRCILEGELLVWSDVECKLLPFHKLRKHVVRSGSYIGTENDSPPHSFEHLYVMFFDILLIDDDACLSKSYRERRALLQEVVHPVTGRAGFAEQEYINFSLSNGQDILKESFALAISQRWEGLVLKGAEEPYFTLDRKGNNPSSGHWIKLKKDYIAGLGDTADFAIIGARYDAREAAKLNHIAGLKWTSFFVGCRERIIESSHDARAVYRLTDVLDRNSMHIRVMQTLNQFGQFSSCDMDSEAAPFRINRDQMQMPQVQVLLQNPFVVEMLGSGFERPSGVNYYTLRFPRILKIHTDRDVEDATTLEDLQKLAEEANSVPTDELSQEAALWLDRLDAADGKPGYIIDVSQHSTTSVDSILSRLEVENGPCSALTPLPTSVQRNPTYNLPCLPAKAASRPSSPVRKRKEIESCQGGLNIPNQKRSRRLRSQSPCVAIHSDNAQTTANNDSPLQDNPYDRHLANLTNLSQPNSSQTNNIATVDHTGVVPIPSTDNEIECSATVKRHKETRDSIPGQHSSQCTVSARKKTSIPMSINFDSEPNHHSSHPTESTLSLAKIPILLGTGVSIENVKCIAPTTNRLLTSSISDFLHNLLELPFPNKHPHKPPGHRGIVLVDPTTQNATQTASDIATIGNALVAKQRAAKGLISRRGIVVFLNHESLVQHGLISSNEAEQLEQSRARWREVGKRVFAGCLKWGYGASSRARKGKRREPDCGSGHGISEGFGLDSSSSQGEEVDVRLSWNWREILSLF